MKAVVAVALLLLLAVPAFAQEPTIIYLINPCRILDTRNNECGPGGQPPRILYPYTPCPTGPFYDGETRTYLVQASEFCPGSIIPLQARGLIVTLTATGASGRGHLSIFDPTVPRSSVTSSLNFGTELAVANTTMTKLGQVQGLNPGEPILPDLAISAHVSGGGTVHVVVDVLGYLGQ